MGSIAFTFTASKRLSLTALIKKKITHHVTYLLQRLIFISHLFCRVNSYLSGSICMGAWSLRSNYMRRCGVGRPSIRFVIVELAPDTVPSGACDECRLSPVVGDDGYAPAAGTYEAGVWEVAALVTATNWRSGWFGVGGRGDMVEGSMIGGFFFEIWYLRGGDMREFKESKGWGGQIKGSDPRA